MKKKAVILLLLIMCGLYFFTGKAFVIDAQAGTRTEVDIYVCDSYKGLLVMPANYPQQYQISISGATNVKYSVTEGDTVTVSNTGLVKPNGTTYYWRNGMGTTYNDGGEYDSITTDYKYGTSIVTATAGGKSYEYAVTLRNYAQVYADQVMDAYLNENIKSDMSNMEKLEVIAKFPCQYDYSVQYSSAEGMIISGGGDCWASTDAIIRLAEKLGFKARTRDGRGDVGAGSGHMNAAVRVDGKMYVVEAGYEGTAPRYYEIWEEDEYKYEVNDDNQTAVLTGYLGVDDVLTIPSEIDGYKITEIGRACFYFGDDIKSVVFPDTINKIDDYAFYCVGLQSVVIPDSVTDIGKDAFMTCIDYDGPGGSYGAILPLEMIELPTSIKTLGMNLSDSVVLYHGTKDDWNKISFTDSYVAPKGENLFFTTKRLEIPATAANIKVKEGETVNIPVYSIGNDIRMVNYASNVITASVNVNTRQYYYSRDGKRTPVTSDIRSLQIKGLKIGQAQVKLSIDNAEIVLNVNVEEKSSSSTPEIENSTRHKKPTPINSKKAQSLRISTAKKTVKFSKLKKKARTVKPITVKNAKGKVTYKIVGGNKKSKKALKIDAKTGAVKVKKRTGKGTYKVKVKVTAAGNSTYKAESVTVTISVRVK